MKESGRIVPVEPVVSKRTVSLCHGSISYRQQIARVFVHPVACLNRLVLSLYIHFPSNLLFPEQRRRCCSPVPMEDKTVTPISTPSSESATFDIGSIQVKTKYILAIRVFCFVCYFIMRSAAGDLGTLNWICAQMDLPLLNVRVVIAWGLYYHTLTGVSGINKHCGMGSARA